MKKIINQITNKTLNEIDMCEYELIDDLEYQKYYKSPSSIEHYRLLSYLSQKISNSILVDVGTLKGSSALALSKNITNKVFSFNLNEELRLKSKPSNIDFIIDDITKPNYINILKESKLILLDTFHDGTFERLFYEHLKMIKFGGILILDDIKLNNEMVEFWNYIEKEKDDLTNFGHITGTGIVYF